MKKSTTKKTTSKRKKQLQKQTSHWNRLKFLPAILIAVFASFLWAQPGFVLSGDHKDVLAYATDVSPSGLLASTNAERSGNGVGGLSINSQLASAAQAKANDMVTRNYWSHETPDGQQPWVFITNAGYQYLSAGENLAYGFMTSSGTVTGWMNSPPHKANLLSGTFTEVGFGIANSPSYVGNGPQTVVVAMYGKPQVLAATPPAPQQTAAPAPVKQTAQETPAPVEEAPALEKAEEEEKPKDEEIIAVGTNEETPTATGTNVQRIQLLTGGNAIWSTTFVVLGVCAIGVLWLIHRGFRFKQWFRASEKFIGSHLYLDLAVLAVIYLGFVLLSTSGTIK